MEDSQGSSDENDEEELRDFVDFGHHEDNFDDMPGYHFLEEHYELRHLATVARVLDEDDEDFVPENNYPFDMVEHFY